jgi:hypothetical protein
MIMMAYRTDIGHGPPLDGLYLNEPEGPVHDDTGSA